MLRVDTTWSGVPGAPYYTGLHFAGEDAAAASAAHAIVVQAWTALATEVRDDLDATVEPEVSVIEPTTGLTTATFLEPSVTVPMTGAGARQPLVVQGLVSLRTGVYDAGREIRGKVFHPGTLDTRDTDGRPSTAYQTALSTVWGDVITDSTTAGIPLQVYSPTKFIAAAVTAAGVWNEWAILRSRRD